MKVVSLPDVEPGGGPRRVAIGTFDGVHLGHREVIRGADTVLTFDPHPMSVIRPEATPRLISTFPVKRDLIAGLGVEELVVIPFDRGFASQTAEEFVERRAGRPARRRAGVGGGELPVRQGRQGHARLPRASTASSRRAWCRSWRPPARPSPPATSAGSWRPARWRPAAEFLGGPFLFEGEVVAGDRRGRELGMPTANIVPDEHYVVPGHGVYAAWAHGHPAAVNVGVRPTFDTGRGLLVEAHLIGFDGDIYGETLRIAFLERLRGEKRFDSVDELVEQMNRDVDEAKRIAEARAAQVAEAGRLQRQLPLGVVLVAEHAAVAELDDRG